jgi:hypothetical protein
MDSNALDDDLGERLCHWPIIAPNVRTCRLAGAEPGQGLPLGLGLVAGGTEEDDFGLDDAGFVGVLDGLREALIRLPLSIQ